MYTVGDFIKVMGQDNATWFAEVVGVSDATLEVFFIEKGMSSDANGSLNQNVWTYTPEWHTIPHESVMEHIDTKSNGVVKALQLLGFRPLNEDSFVKLDEHGDVPIGMDLPMGDDFIGIHPEMRDFIVPDEEGESFSFAAPASKFVRETHEAVHGFNNWIPKDNEIKIKEFVDAMSRQECIKENARTKLGCGLSYDRPPL
jgi:hypothetical protein|tara:strand:+ start:2601 stop:3200 length:600 start_codon:yes stop_codon:yes gene_type:complete